MQVRHIDRYSAVFMLLLCASWSLQQIAAKLAMPEVGPLTQAAIRSVGAGLLVGGWALWREPRILARDGTLGGGLLAGVLFALEFFLLFIGLQLTSASHAILFLYTAPFFVALGAVWLLPDERLRPLQWAGLALSFAGVALALRVSGSMSREMLLGDLLTLAAGAMWGATTLTIKATALRFAPATKILLYQLLASAALLTVAALVSSEPWPRALSAMALGSLAYQTIWIASLTFLGWMWLVSHYHAGELSAFSFVTPVMGVLAGWAIMGDPMSPTFLVAVAMVAAGILLVNWPAAK
ncbi:MAG: Permease of the drug/metabolite transporter superfamily [Hyphomicrobiales bacterium]|nr:Permease of the drug/metabolite transporter superfamily [Hyphomicrobiales bacterium]